MSETGCLGVIVEPPIREAMRIIASLKDAAHDDLERMTLSIQRGGTPHEMSFMLDAHRVLQAEHDGLKKALQRAQDAAKARESEVSDE